MTFDRSGLAQNLAKSERWADKNEANRENRFVSELLRQTKLTRFRAQIEEGTEARGFSGLSLDGFDSVIGAMGFPVTFQLYKEGADQGKITFGAYLDKPHEQELFSAYVDNLEVHDGLNPVLVVANRNIVSGYLIVSSPSYLAENVPRLQFMRKGHEIVVTTLGNFCSSLMAMTGWKPEA